MNNSAYLHLIKLTETIAKIDQESVSEVIRALEETRDDNRTVFLFGNGGSHSTASHFANDLYKMCGLKAVCISDMAPIILAFMNDISQEAMFSLAMRQHIGEKDVMIAFSCSGNSDNVVTALRNAKKTQKKILFTGPTGGSSANLANITVFVPHGDIKIQESAHLALCHAIAEALHDPKM